MNYTNNIDLNSNEKTYNQDHTSSIAKKNKLEIPKIRKNNEILNHELNFLTSETFLFNGKTFRKNINATKYISKYKNTENYPLYAVIGLPGVIKNNELIACANISHWPKANGDEYAKKFGIKKFIFINDFACNAYGIQTNS